MSFSTVTSGGTSSAATHSSLAYLVLCETVCRWKSSLCLFSPTWWFRLVGVPEACQVQSPWWCQIFPHQDRLSSAKHRNHICLFSHSACRITQIRCKTPWNVFYCLLWFVKQIVDVCVLHDELHPKACNCNIWLHFAFLALPFSINLFVSLVILTLSLLMQPEESQVNISSLTFWLSNCVFPVSLFSQLYPVLFQLHFTPPPLPFLSVFKDRNNTSPGWLQ